MKAIKLLTQVNIYLPSIYRALTKYACNLYRKCTGRVLKDNRLLYSDFFLINFAPSSRSLRVGSQWASSGLRRTCRESRSPLEGDSGGGRTALEQRSKKGRRNAVKHQMDVLEQFLAATRSISAFNQIRTLFYRKPSIHRFCTAYFPSLTREMDGAGTLQLRCRDRKVQNKVRTRLKQSTNQIQIGFLSFLLNLMQKVVFKVAKSVPLVYGLFTGSVPILYREGTEKLLRRYQRATKASSLAVDLQSERRPAWEHRCSCISQACVVHMLSNGQAWIVRKTVPVDTLSMHYQRSIYASSILDRCLKNASFQISAFKRFNLFSQVYGWFCINNAPNLFKSTLNRPLASGIDVIVQRNHCKIMKTGRAFSLLVLLFFNLLDCVLTELKSIRTYSLLVLMFSMFSLSAQTPRKDSGADGLSHLIALKPGDKIPDAVWNQTLELNYFDGKKKTIKFSDLKGKLIILDFWSTGCAACIEGIPNMELIQDRFKGKVEIIMVNSKRNRDTPERIKNRFKKYREDFNYTPRLATLLDDTVFTRLFEHNTLPSQAILNGDGKFLATTGGALTDRNINRVLYENSNPFEHIGSYVNLSRDYNDVITDTVGLSYSSSLSKMRPHYLPVGPGISHPNENSLMQMGNLSLQNFLSYLFMEELDGFSWNDYVFDPQLGQNFKQKLFATSSENTYWYQLYKNAVISEDKAKKFARQDFMRYFEVGVQRKTDTADLYQITFNKAINKIQTKGKMRIIRIQELDEESQYQNVPIDFFLRNLFCYLDLPMYKFSKESFKIDINLPKGFINWAESQKVAFLKEKGIVLTRVREKREFPYIYSHK